MKRFQFQLESVLGYKQQALDALMAELGAAQAEVARQRAVRDAVRRRLDDYGAEYEAAKEEGITIADARKYQACLDALERELKREERRLREAVDRAEEKRLEVVAARQDAMSLEKLRDMRRKEYDAAAAKDEEKAIDDLTIARRHLARASA